MEQRKKSEINNDLSEVFETEDSENTASEKADSNVLFLTNNDVELVPPDGGWGWVVLVAGFVTLGLGFMPLASYGILFAPMFLKYNVSSANIAWIFNVQAFIWNFSTLMVGPFCEEYGWRIVSVVGGIANALSLILSGFVPRYEYLFFTFSILGAVGGSIGSSVCFFVVSKYFVRRRGFALGIITLGVCTASFISPLLSNYLLEKYGFQGAALILGGILLHQGLAGTLFHPVQWHMKLQSIVNESDYEDHEFSKKENGKKSIELSQFEKAKQKAIKLRNKQLHKFSGCSHFSVGSYDPSSTDVGGVINSDKETKPVSKDRNTNVKGIHKTSTLIRVLQSTYTNLKCLRSMRVLLIALSSAGLMMGYVNFQMWVPFVIRDSGHSLEMSAWALSTAAIANTCGRAITAAVSDWSRFNVIIAYMTGLLITAASIVGFSMFTNVYYLFVCLSIWGYSIGMVMSLHPTVMIKTMGLDMFPAVYGLSSLFISFAFVTVGPAVGMIRDATSSYKVTLWILASLVFTSFLMWLVMPICKKYDLKKENTRREEQP